MKQGMIFMIGIFLMLFLIACGGNTDSKSSASTASSDTPKEETTSAEKSKDAQPATTNRRGRLIYKQYCVICHGADGKLAVSDAKDLSVSTIDMEERINQITNGKGLMTPYKDILSEEQIRDVAEYLDELKQ